MTRPTTKTPYVDRLNPARHAATPGAEHKRREAGAFAALNSFVRKHGGWVTSPPGKILRIEVMRDSALPARLAELGYHVQQCGTVTRTTGAAPSAGRAAERTNGEPSAFTECDVIEIRLDGR